MTEEPEVPSHSQTEIIEWEKNLDYNSTDLGEMGKFIRVEYAKNILQKAITTAVAKRDAYLAEEVRNELVKITNDNCVRDFHPGYGDGVVNGKKEALFKVLSILKH